MDYSCKTSWYAIHTYASREAVAAMNIERLGLEVFLPQIKEKKRVWGVPQMVIKPLFSGYIFARFAPNSYLHMIQYARGVRRVVGNGDRPTPVDDEIISAVRAGIGEDGYLQIEPQQLHRGDRVTVQEGPLQGLRGILDQDVGDRERVVILLEAIEFQARLLIEKRYLKPQAEAL
jgi:transcriptional antiterminator RfaH